jgi:hypothetical protein
MKMMWRRAHLDFITFSVFTLYPILSYLGSLISEHPEETEIEGSLETSAWREAKELILRNRSRSSVHKHQIGIQRPLPMVVGVKYVVRHRVARLKKNGKKQHPLSFILAGWKEKLVLEIDPPYVPTNNQHGK